MERGLVVLDDTETHREVLDEAVDFAVGSDARLVLFAYLTSEEYKENLETMEQVSKIEHTSYSSETASGTAVQFAKRIATDVIGDREVEYEIVTKVIDEDEVPNAILEVGDEEECDHVFIVGRQRSPTGKLVFGDTAQKIILNFDGRVTTELV